MKQEATKRAESTESEASNSDAVLHKAPSMLWFIVPLGLLMLYAVLSR